ncbi:MAG: LytTR family transcriptional regulator [bacterium]|nr:LytTR family transcriptional regulator [bacterium]
MNQTLERRVDFRRFLPLFGIWAVAVAVSTLQIWLREVAYGFPTPWLAVLWANCLAWSPWLPIAAFALWAERRFPVRGPARWWHAALHTISAALVSAIFLMYLTLFHWTYLDGRAIGGRLAAIRVEYLEKLDRFFLTAALLYGAIVLAGLAARAYRSQREAAPARDADSPVLVVRSVGRVEQIPASDVLWIESCGNYARLHLEGRAPLIRRTLASLADELGSLRFARVHRSAIVNLDRVVELRRRTHGEATLVLQGGQTLKVSRTYRAALKDIAG